MSAVAEARGTPSDRLAALEVVSSDAVRRLASRLTGRDLPLPWMTALDARAVAHIVRRADPTYVLEWGSGHSTGRFPREAPHLRRWVSVEHDAAWHARIARRAPKGGVELVLVPPDAPASAPGDGAAFRDYVAYPAGLGLEFDLVLIDGKARLDCLRASRGMLSQRGIVVLHDAQLFDYASVAQGFGHSVELEDPRNGFRILVAGASQDPRAVLDMGHLGGLYTAVGGLHSQLLGALGRAYLALTF